MTQPTFTPDETVHVHKEGAIRLLCAAFRSHEDGLPEWIKNSADAYARGGIPEHQSTILILLRDAKGSQPASIACMDFGGMDVADIEDKFRRWADPAAAGDAVGVQGGHGNGGKCYMTQLFETYSLLHTLKDGHGNRYGFRGGNPNPGYFPSVDQGRNYPVADAEVEIFEALKPFGVRLADLPEPARAAWHARHAFTLVVGVGAKNLRKGRIPAPAWADNLAGHQQMVMALTRCQVFAFHNGALLASANPLRLPEIEPIPGAEAPRTIAIPTELVDPRSDQSVPTGASTGSSRLELRTSAKSMRHSKKGQARHTIAGWTLDGKSTGFWEMNEISSAPFAGQIYGDVHLEALADYRQNDRRHHSPAPLTSALQHWMSLQVQAYSDEFAEQERLHATQEQKDELSRLNRELNSWKDAFLKQEYGGLGQGAEGQTGSDRDRRPLPRGKVTQVVLRLTHQMAGVGVALRPDVQFLDAAGNRVRSIPHEWETSDGSVIAYDQALNLLVTGKPGRSQVSVVCKDSGVRSTALDVEVLELVQIDLAPSEITLPAGSRNMIYPLVTTADGRVVEGVYLTWTEGNSAVASVGSGGAVYGLTPGVTEVTAGDDRVLAITPAVVTVVEADNDEKGGSGFPTILLSEIDTDPLGEIPPAFPSTDPPVCQRPQDVDANIWWINMAAPLARRYFAREKGGGMGSREWRVYHLERYVEILVKIILTYDFNNGEDLTFETMLRKWDEGSTQMQTRAAETLVTFLDGGEIGPVPQ